MGNSEQLGMIKELALALLDEVESLAKLRDPSAPGEAEEGDAGFYGMIEAYEKFLIRRALLRARGNQARAARILRLKPTTLHHKMKVYDIKPGPKESDCPPDAAAAGRAGQRPQTGGPP